MILYCRKKKRARRRLIGALVLALAAIIGLPVVLDPYPQPVVDDIVIQLPNRVQTHTSRPLTQTTHSVGARAENGPPSKLASSDKAARARPTLTTTHTASGNRFAIELGVFPDEQHALVYLKRLKQANVPAYLERNKESSGRVRLFVRAGPFPDRASAQAALRRMREAGLALKLGEASAVTH